MVGNCMIKVSISYLKDEKGLDLKHKSWFDCTSLWKDSFTKKIKRTRGKVLIERLLAQREKGIVIRKREWGKNPIYEN